MAREEFVDKTTYKQKNKQTKKKRRKKYLRDVKNKGKIYLQGDQII